MGHESIRGRGPKPRDAFDRAAYASRSVFKLSHGRLLANLESWQRITQDYDMLGRQRMRVSNAERWDSEDVPKTSNVLRNSKGVPQRLCHVCQGTEGLS